MATVTAVRMASPSKSAKHLQKMLRMDRLKTEEDGQRGRIDEEQYGDDDDKGEGTSAAGAALAGLAAKHLDIAALLKDPLVFVPARMQDDAQFKIPYEPLPTGPSRPQNVVQASTTTNGTDKVRLTNGTAAPKRDSDLASSSPASVASDSKGKQVATQPLADIVVPLPMSWPRAYPVGPGYHNLGNTCFLNSTLQALTHTAPLVSCLVGDTYHSLEKCPLARNRRPCVLCQMQKHVRICFPSNKRQYGALRPDTIVGSLNLIAKHMRVGRQEDAHEFLRFFLDKMQDSAATSMNPPAKTEVEKEKTFLYRIFGGKLRSRVSCLNCKHDSDTIDRIMDLSLDVSRVDTVKDALQAFIKIDMLQGNNKYKCEKCKKLVNARKQFTIKLAPQILHVHLKRFTPTGKKISGHIQYPEYLDLSPYMSDDAIDLQPRYRLYAVVCHAGGGPHSGHYFAHVRAANGDWHNMNDSSVSNSSTQSALGLRNAYLLFYERSNRLGDALGLSRQGNGGQPARATVDRAHANGHMVNGSGTKRKEREEEEQASPFPPQKLKLGGVHAGANLMQSRPGSPLKQHLSPGSPKSRQNGNARGPPYAIPEKKHSSSPATLGPRGFYTSQKNRPKIVDLMRGRHQ